MRVVIFGSTGLLGQSIKNYLALKNYKCFGSSLKKNSDFKSDLQSDKKIIQFLNKSKPKIVINCVSETNVDLCNANFKIAYRSNVLTIRNIVKALKKTNKKIHLIHISTDQVYDSKFASEENQTNISNIYGVTKFLGELETLNYKESLILRTNFFGKSFSKKRNSYSDYIINNLSKNNKIRIPSNVFFNPIHIESLNSIILKLIKKRAKGIINIGSKDVISKFNFAKLIAKKKKLSKRFLSSYQSVYLVNKRPLSTFMSTKKLRKTINIKIPSIYDEIKRL